MAGIRVSRARGTIPWNSSRAISSLFRLPLSHGLCGGERSADHADLEPRVTGLVVMGFASYASLSGLTLNDLLFTLRLGA